MNKAGIIFFSVLYIGLHLSVGIYGIREWPFTDYPMFADSYEKEDIISVYSYWIKTKDNNFRKLGRAFGDGYGSTEWNVSKLIKDKNYDQLKEYFSHWIKKQGFKQDFESLVIKKEFASIPSNGSSFKKNEEVVYTILKDDID